MTLSLFWSRYTLELQERHLRDVDALYRYVIAREKWNWLLAKIPESEQIRILRGHTHGDASWSCRKWLDHMLEWIKENKPETVYQAVVERVRAMEHKNPEELEKQAALSLSAEELQHLQEAGYFQCVPAPERKT
ncbi:hypothetical protein [uncultured Megasphaera sp.]|uniref:hypothetical protein n=1 Tax=uncultured Megasphaera sp. TaxID=165188 RepID=UPI00265B1AEE|nr:hypothetical protein [uncultured Megasphaera sp.]